TAQELVLLRPPDISDILHRPPVHERLHVLPEVTVTRPREQQSQTQGPRNRYGTERTFAGTEPPEVTDVILRPQSGRELRRVHAVVNHGLGPQLWELTPLILRDGRHPCVGHQRPEASLVLVGGYVKGVKHRRLAQGLQRQSPKVGVAVQHVK